MTSLQIKYFLTAARCLNFTEAARQLYISQPVLSQQIAAMEKELNMQLFIRSKGKVFLTPAGGICSPCKICGFAGRTDSVDGDWIGVQRDESGQLRLPE